MTFSGGGGGVVAGDMEAGGGVAARSSSGEEEARRGGGVVEDWCCACAGLLMRPNPMVARYMYALIFLVTNLLAWTLRDYGDSALAELQRACLFVFLQVLLLPVRHRPNGLV
jgi:hypothetical protein